MKRFFPLLPFSLLAIIFSTGQTQAQSEGAEKLVRPRSVAAAAASQTSQLPSKQATEQQSGVSTQRADAAPANVATPPLAGTENTVTSAPGTVLQLTPALVHSRISEARRLLKSRPLQTALTTPSIDWVTLAALDRETSRTHLVTFLKQTFLTKGAELTVTSSLGTPLTVRVLRANGVNTALSIVTPDGKSLTPLLVEYPIERGGLFREMAYYTSAHPSLLSNDLMRSGQAYVRNMLDLAAKRLSEKGVAISPTIINIAERLCIVEHTDHDRFRNENRLALFSEIYSLYALNEVDTYRYSVSVAGAGGMVQMIPWAYNLMRQRHPGVGLIPDFVTAMRNHGNALQAMLLYMQDTWNDLSANDDVKYALNAKIATPSELMAAGYNSNAAKLPSYIRRGGDDWKTLIPRETQMYLQIYKSFESLVPIKARTNLPAPTDD